MGGEPLLHPEIMKFFDISRRYFDGQVNLVTNGILLTSQSDSFWESLRDINIRIMISRYPIKLDTEKIETKAEQYGIEIVHTAKTADGLGKWYKFPLDLTSSQNIREARRKCIGANVCL